MKGLSILIAEDSNFNQLMIEKVVADLGYNSITVANGKEVLVSLQNYKFDVILMDLEMPVMDGITATKKIRENNSGLSGNIIIIALTSHKDSAILSNLKQQGFDAYLHKPLTPEDLKKMVDSLLENRNQIEIVTPATHLESEEIIQLEYLKSMSGGDTEFEIQIINMFLDLAPKALGRMREFATTHNYQALGGEAHKLASQIDFFGITNAVGPLSSIENFSLNEINTLHLPGLIDQLEKACLQAIEALKKISI